MVCPSSVAVPQKKLLLDCCRHNQRQFTVSAVNFFETFLWKVLCMSIVMVSVKVFSVLWMVNIWQCWAEILSERKLPNINKYIQILSNLLILYRRWSDPRPPSRFWPPPVLTQFLRVLQTALHSVCQSASDVSYSLGLSLVSLHRAGALVIPVFVGWTVEWRQQLRPAP